MSTQHHRDEFLRGRFVTRALLGEGGLGRVYAVRDTEIGVDLAIKTLRDPSGPTSLHLKREFRALADISHRNLVELHQLFVTDDEVFFTMELLDAVSFTEHVRADGPGFPADAQKRLFAALEQLVPAVEALHRANRLHRDIKPSNVLVTRAGRVVLLDFDLTAIVEPEQALGGDEGTPAYMPPEQFWGGHTLAPSTDWYSLGVLVCESITGSLPYIGSIEEILEAKLAGSVPDLRGAAPDISQPLADLVPLLLHPDPVHRAGQLEIRAMLRLARAVSDAPSPLAKSSPPGGTLDTRRHENPWPFVGRLDELHRLDVQLTRVRDGRMAVARVVGSSGSGKTTLVNRFLSGAAAGGELKVLRGRCHPREALAYRAVDRLVDGLADALGKAPQLPTLSPSDRGALVQLFPVLSGVARIGEGAAADDLEPHALRRRGSGALRELLGALATNGLVALWIDDLQWGDVDSAELLGDLLRAPDPPRVLVILSYRPQEAQESDFFRVLDQALPPAAGEIIHVGPFSEAEGADLAAALGAPEAVRNRVAASLAEAGFQPLLVAELVAESDSAPSTSPGDDHELTLNRIFRNRFDALDADERRLVELLAVAGRPLEERLLWSAAQVQPFFGLGGLRRARLIRFSETNGEPAIEAFHDRSSETLLMDMPPEVLRKRHRSLADALLASPSAAPEALAVHLLGAGDEAGAARAAVDAGDRAAEKLAFDRAAHFYRTARLVTADRSEPWVLDEKLGDALANGGRSGAAGAAYASAARGIENAVAPPSDGASRIRDLRRRSAEHYLRAGLVAEGTEMMRRVLRSVELHYPSSQPAAFASYLVEAGRLALRGDAAAVFDSERAAAAIPRLNACWAAGLGFAWIDRMRSAAFQPLYKRLALDAGEPSHIVRALGAEASQLAAIGGAKNRAKSQAVLHRAETLARATKNPAGIAFAELMAGSVAFYGARWRDAQVLCERAEEIINAGLRGAAWEMTTSRILRLASLAYLGEYERLGRELPALLDEARGRGDRLAAATLASGLPNLAWLGADQPEEALQRADRAMTDWPRTDFQTQHYFDLVARSHIDLYQGRGLAALRRIKGTWRALQLSLNLMVEHFRTTLFYLRGRAALVGAAEVARSRDVGREHRALLSEAAAAARYLAGQDTPWSHALSLLVLAGLAASERASRERPEELFHAAAEALARLDMPVHAAAARRSAGRCAGGDSGRDLVAVADEALLRHGVKSAERTAALWAPCGNPPV